VSAHALSFMKKSGLQLTVTHIHKIPVITRSVSHRRLSADVPAVHVEVEYNNYLGRCKA
jgi:hypothetical protein